MKDNDSTVNKVLGRRLQSIRQAQNLKVTELAELSGFSRSSIQNYEAGTRQPSLAVIARLADALGCNPAWLATFTESETGDDVLTYHLVNKRQPGQDPLRADSVMYSVNRIQMAGCLPTETMLITAEDNFLSPEIYKGDEVLIDTSKNAVVGVDIYCFRDRGGRLLLRYAREELGRAGYTLYANNDSHVPHVFIGDEASSVEIVGRVINVTRWR